MPYVHISAFLNHNMCSHTINKWLPSLFSATFYTFLCFLLVILMLKMIPRHSAEMLSLFRNVHKIRLCIDELKNTGAETCSNTYIPVVQYLLIQCLQWLYRTWVLQMRIDCICFRWWVFSAVQQNKWWLLITIPFHGVKKTPCFCRVLENYHMFPI